MIIRISKLLYSSSTLNYLQLKTNPIILAQFVWKLQWIINYPSHKIYVKREFFEKQLFFSKNSYFFQKSLDDKLFDMDLFSFTCYNGTQNPFQNIFQNYSIIARRRDISIHNSAFSVKNPVFTTTTNKAISWP